MLFAGVGPLFYQVQSQHKLGFLGIASEGSPQCIDAVILVKRYLSMLANYTETILFFLFFFGPM